VGVGAVEHREQPSSGRSEWWRQIFLIDHPQPGRVLPSGHITSYDRVSQAADAFPTQWLSTCCCAYDRAVLRKIQFDGRLRGALFEDRDLSYRISQIGALAAVPRSTYVHHRSPINRRSAAQFSRDRLIQRYWFVNKNISHTSRWWAFWWATLGHLIALLVSSKGDKKWKALRGHLQGIREILSRNHPLLT
jgi:GT2 family glycosyltransferase